MTSLDSGKIAGKLCQSQIEVGNFFVIAQHCEVTDVIGQQKTLNVGDTMTIVESPLESRVCFIVNGGKNPLAISVEECEFLVVEQEG
jgi:hypothetical protein